MTKAEQPTITQAVEVTQADIDAVKRFHAESAIWLLNAIKSGDPIGEERDLNHPIYQAFARHRTTSLAAQDWRKHVALLQVKAFVDEMIEGKYNCSPHQYFMAAQGRAIDIKPVIDAAVAANAAPSLAAQDGLVEAIEDLRHNYRAADAGGEFIIVSIYSVNTVLDALSAIKGDKS